MSKSAKVYVGTIVVWVVLCIVYNGWRLATYTPSPIDGDFYAHNSGYQLVMVLIFRLPIWIIALLVILCAEMVVLKRREKLERECGPGAEN